MWTAHTPAPTRGVPALRVQGGGGTRETEEQALCLTGGKGARKVSADWLSRDLWRVGAWPADGKRLSAKLESPGRRRARRELGPGAAWSGASIPLSIQQIPVRHGAWQLDGGGRSAGARRPEDAPGWGQGAGAPGPERPGGCGVGEGRCGCGVGRCRGSLPVGWANAEGWWGHAGPHVDRGNAKQVHPGAGRAVHTGARFWR